MVNLIRVDSQARFKKKHVDDILRKRSLSVLFKVINSVNRKQTIYPFQIVEGNFLLKKTELLQQKIGEKRRNKVTLNQETENKVAKGKANMF